MAMLEIKDIHKTFYTYDDKPRFHIGPFPRGNARRVRSALHVPVSDTHLTLPTLCQV